MGTRARVSGQWAVLAVAAAALTGPAAADETHYCTRYIHSLPYTIQAPGHYCLERDLSVPANPTFSSAITIDADSVVVDLNRFTLDGSALGAGTTVMGISGSSRSFVTVRNGVVRGVFVAVELDNASGTARGTWIEDVWADHSWRTGIATDVPQSVVRHNVVTDTGGTTALTTNGMSYAFGIIVEGPASVLDNQVTHTFGLGGGQAWGFALIDQGLIAVGNRVVGADSGGFACEANSDAGPQVILRDNIVLSAPQAYPSPCTSIAGTNFP